MTRAVHHELTGTPGRPVLVLGNSLGTDLAMWDQVVALLADRFHILRYDHRGQGASPVPNGPYTAADLGRDVVDLLDRLEVASAVYAGVSIGGMVAQWLAAHGGGRISRAAVFNSSAHPGNPDAWEERAYTVTQAGSVAVVADAVVARWLTPPFATDHPDLRNDLHTMLCASPVAGYGALCRLLAELDLRADLTTVTIPVLVVGGAQDEALPLAHSELIARLIPDARYEVLDPAAHIPMVESPQAVASLISDHLLEN